MMIQTTFYSDDIKTAIGHEVEVEVEKKVVIKYIVPQRKLLEHKIKLKEGEVRIMVNLTRKEVDFFNKKWQKKTKCLTKESFVNFLCLYGSNGIEAKLHPSELPENSYWKIDAISNSKLSRFKDKLLERDSRILGRNGVFGSCFHELILEPEKYSLEKYNLRDSEIHRLGEMKKAINKDSLTQKILKVPGLKLETEKIWTDENTALRCKGKLDILLQAGKYNEVTDLKTTGARSQKEFEEYMQAYDYDRQGAFYTIGAKAKRCRFIGVQKIEPYNIYHYCFDLDSKFMKRGIHKVNFLMKKYKELKAT